MFVHFAVPVASSSAVPRPTSMFVILCRSVLPEFSNIDTFATQRETRNVYVGIFSHGILYIQPRLREK